MSELSRLFIRKNGVVKDSLRDFGFATGEISFPGIIEMKEFASRDCPGEDGERVFFPQKPPIKAYDIDVTFIYKGTPEAYYTEYREFTDYLTGRDGNGSELAIYTPWYRIGRQKVYLKQIEEGNFSRSKNDLYLKIKAKFHISDPVTDILLIV